jgi:hypothetical protein
MHEAGRDTCAELVRLARRFARWSSSAQQHDPVRRNGDATPRPARSDFSGLAVAAKSEAPALITGGTAVVSAMTSLQGKMIDRLNELLKARVDGMVMQRNLTMLAVGLALLAAASVEQTAAAASVLKDRAVGLATEVAQFRLPAG